MTRDESLQVVAMILSGWPALTKDWQKDEIDMYARSIQDLDAELATHVVLRAVKTDEYPPKVPHLREMVRAEKRRLAPEVAPPEPPEGRPVPMWVKRWVCARLLYERFGKERDMRRFPEQGNHGDLTQEMMPEGAWDKEAAQLSDEELRQEWAKNFRP